MVTVQGSWSGFILAGALVILTNRFWGLLYSWLAQFLYSGLFGHPLPPEALNGPVLRACRLSTVLVGAVLMVIGVALLIDG